MSLGCNAGVEPLCGLSKEQAQAQTPSSASVRSVQGCAMCAQMLCCITGLLNQTKSGVLQAANSHWQSLLSTSSCQACLILPPQTHTISCEITSMTRREVRCKVNY